MIFIMAEVPHLRFTSMGEGDSIVVDTIAVDTNVEFSLAERDGRWRGRQSGRYIDGRYPLCAFHFPQKGIYQFVVSHAMRDTILAGMHDVGMTIQKLD